MSRYTTLRNTKYINPSRLGQRGDPWFDGRGEYDPSDEVAHLRLGGRESEISEVICGMICDRLRRGGTLMEACLGAGMPGRSTVYRWIKQFPKFAEEYNAAVASRKREKYISPRKSSYSAPIAMYIYEEVKQGRSLNSILSEPGMPSSPTFRRWRRDRPKLDKAIRDALEEKKQDDNTRHGAPPVQIRTKAVRRNGGGDRGGDRG